MMLDTYEKQAKLAATLDRSAEVREFDSADEPQSWTLAYNLSHLEESCTKLLEQLPKLIASNPPHDDVNEVLFEIGYELHHILYHATAADYYGYLRQ